MLWKTSISGFAIAALFTLFARSLGFDWVTTLGFLALYALILFARIRHPRSPVTPGRAAPQFSRRRPV
jgi:hypothetical protein